MTVKPARLFYFVGIKELDEGILIIVPHDPFIPEEGKTACAVMMQIHEPDVIYILTAPPPSTEVLRGIVERRESLVRYFGSALRAIACAPEAVRRWGSA